MKCSAGLYQGVRIFLISILTILFVSLSIGSAEAIECDEPDKTFDFFLQQFKGSVEYQRNRIIFPLVVRFGDYSGPGFVVELWDLKHVQELEYDLIFSDQVLSDNHIDESVLLSTVRYKEVFLSGPPESDVYRILYKFRNIGGCWFLEEMHDRSK